MVKKKNTTSIHRELKEAEKQLIEVKYYLGIKDLESGKIKLDIVIKHLNNLNVLLSE